MSTPFISLFTGAGGLDLGLARAGFEAAVAVEHDKRAQETLRANYPNLPVLGDITQLSSEDILAASGLTEVSLIAGGPPCQSFSTVGKERGLFDPRGLLFRDFARVVMELRPRFFLMENVTGILLANKKQAWPAILATFGEAGYQLAHSVLKATDYGVPQARERVILIGSRDYELPCSSVSQLVPPTTMTPATLWDAVGHLRDTEHEYPRYSAKREATYRLIPPGKNWRYLRDTYGEEFTVEAMGNAFYQQGGKVGYLRRLTWDRPCPTLPTSPNQLATGLCHPDEVRPLSIQEYCAIQQFPPDYVICGTLADRYKQVGNAVPAGLGEAIGHMLAYFIAQPITTFEQARVA